MDTPVVLIIFKRPDTTQRVFDAIRQAQPKQLFVIADGPRPERLGEDEQCAKTRSLVEQIDWDCKLYTNYSDTNLGCATRVTSGLNWVFEHVDRAIILEDDCLPHPTFFAFCEDILETYKNDSRVFSVTGQNVQFGQKRGAYSYYFSRYSHCWGWATWKRAWDYFDFEMSLWPKVKEDGVLNWVLDSPMAAERWVKLLDWTYSGQIDSWAYRWSLSGFLQNSLHVIPNENLISNIGFAQASTNTHSRTSKLANIPAKALDQPLIHPPYVVRHADADRFTQAMVYAPKGKKAKLKALARQVTPFLR